MLGAVIGDIVGSRFEWDNHRSKNFEFFHDKCFFTDDTIMSLAVAKAILECNGSYADLPERTVKAMQRIGRPYPDSGYGGRFFNWMYSDNPQPYKSYGNGTAMRVSACGFAARSLEEAIELSYEVKANMGAGTARSFFPAFAERAGLRFEKGSTLEELLTCLRSGGAAVVLVSEEKGVRTGLFTHGGHVMAIVGIESDGRLVVLDPSYLPGKFDEEGRAGKVEMKCGVIALVDPEVLHEETRKRQPGAYFLYWRK